MANNYSADVIVVGTGVVGCLVAEQALDAGLSVLMLEAGPRVERWQIVENYRNVPPRFKQNWNAPYPAKPWAPHIESELADATTDYLQLQGPNGRAYRQGYVRYAGGATWHWAGICWRLHPDDMRMKSLYGVGRDWAFNYDTLEPYYTRAEYALGVCGPSEVDLQWPPLPRSKPYPMGRIPFGQGEQRFTEAAARVGITNLPAPQARNSGVSYDGRPPCCGNNNCFPVCPISAKYDAASALPRIEAKGGRILANAVVYRVETDAKQNIQAVHFFNPNKESQRVVGRLFVIACNAIETPKLLLMSKDERNPNGVANHSDQVGRNLMDQPKISAQMVLAEPMWTGVGPVQGSSIMMTGQGDFRSQHAGAMLRCENAALSAVGGQAALAKGLVGKALDAEIRRLSACTARLTIEHEILSDPNNRLTLSDKKDWLGLNKPNIYYDVGEYVRRSHQEYTLPLLKKLIAELGAVESNIATTFTNSDHMMGSCIMGTDPTDSVVDVDCRAHDHPNLFLPGGAAMTTGGCGNSTITMAALAMKAADAIVDQLKRG
ncbi:MULTISPECIES: GMC family oxidoreductase [Rhizobium]|uniref:GMC family oxidoreductase n=2 Tax=Rhizobium TaxID=379 RepID=A0ABY8IMT8_9HYPH|nr:MULTISPECIES: GMC family oxidoreductase [Rhizobium]TQX84134.1 GMC family oxidoreductase [Rhizobium sp. rho-13.1]TQY06859.1 GMC family oxidoreductase [Rhizobium sp. rho-1.1]MBZ5762351.1 GMC family oxidoreductase [Rhizobium sp. VS19-DR96]MBZ5769002.1 GMC family oxidoreductase [Rhizobium sp. VS19-DR129.2]MBZ5775931.1 GMC family oxidoreductase [Rhizobium sp. VS19-DRK62.2]